MSYEELKRTNRIDEDRIDKLKELFPEAVVEGKINMELLNEEVEIFADEFDKSEEFYSLQWQGKKNAKRLAYQKAKGTLKYFENESINGDETKNALIEGDNLEVLRLMQKSYSRKIKMIYIDPPYNTGSDLIYKDDYKDTIESYLEKTKQGDEEGLLTSNPKVGGRYHANWLSMMYPRLKLAKELLKDDGLIFVSIDDNELYNLKLILDEIFGSENFIITLIWHRRQNADNRNINMASTDHEYILVYGRQRESKLKGKEIDVNKYKNPDNDPRGPWASIDLTGLANKNERPNLHFDLIDPSTEISYPPHTGRGWSKSKETMEKLIKNDEILFPKISTGRPRQKKFLKDINNDRTGFSSMLKNVGFTTDGTREVKDLFGEKVMSFPKPSNLIKVLIEQATDNDDIILDFFAGSGTTGQAVLDFNNDHNSNRKFILVQIPEIVKGDYFDTISDIAKERIKKVILKSDTKIMRNSPLDMGFRFYKLGKTNLLKWTNYDAENNIEMLEQNINLFTSSPLITDYKPKDVVIEIMLTQGFSLDSSIKESSSQLWEVTHKDVPFALLVSLSDTLEEVTVNFLVRNRTDSVFICLDKAMTNEQKVVLSEKLNVKTI